MENITHDIRKGTSFIVDNGVLSTFYSDVFYSPDKGEEEPEFVVGSYKGDCAVDGRNMLVSFRSDSAGVMLNKIRAVGFHKGSDLYPFYEVYAPEISYDRGSGLLQMTFWTNLLKDKNEYLPENLFRLVDFEPEPESEGEGEGEGEDVHGMFYWKADIPVGVKRALCVTSGIFMHTNVGGGVVYEGADEGALIFDLVPVFGEVHVLKMFDNNGTDRILLPSSTDDVNYVIKYIPDSESESESEGEFIPPYSAVECYDQFEDLDSGKRIYLVTKPRKNSLNQVFITGNTGIEEGMTSVASVKYPLKVFYTEGKVPKAGDKIGTVKDSWKMEKGKRGFVVYSVNEAEGLCHVRPFNSAGWYVFQNMEDDDPLGNLPYLPSFMLPERGKDADIQVSDNWWWDEPIKNHPSMWYTPWWYLRTILQREMMFPYFNNGDWWEWKDEEGNYYQEPQEGKNGKWVKEKFVTFKTACSFPNSDNGGTLIRLYKNIFTNNDGDDPKVDVLRYEPVEDGFMINDWEKTLYESVIWKQELLGEIGAHGWVRRYNRVQTGNQALCTPEALNYFERNVLNPPSNGDNYFLDCDLSSWKELEIKNNVQYKIYSKYGDWSVESETGLESKTYTYTSYPVELYGFQQVRINTSTNVDYAPGYFSIDAIGVKGFSRDSCTEGEFFAVETMAGWRSTFNNSYLGRFFVIYIKSSADGSKDIPVAHSTCVYINIDDEIKWYSRLVEDDFVITDMEIDYTSAIIDFGNNLNVDVLDSSYWKDRCFLPIEIDVTVPIDDSPPTYGEKPDDLITRPASIEGYSYRDWFGVYRYNQHNEVMVTHCGIVNDKSFVFFVKKEQSQQFENTVPRTITQDYWRDIEFLPRNKAKYSFVQWVDGKETVLFENSTPEIKRYKIANDISVNLPTRKDDEIEIRDDDEIYWYEPWFCPMHKWDYYYPREYGPYPDIDLHLWDYPAWYYWALGTFKHGMGLNIVPLTPENKKVVFSPYYFWLEKEGYEAGQLFTFDGEKLEPFGNMNDEMKEIFQSPWINEDPEDTLPDREDLAGWMNPFVQEGRFYSKNGFMDEGKNYDGVLLNYGSGFNCYCNPENFLFYPVIQKGFVETVSE